TFGGRRMMTCQISDGSGILTMRFFNFNAAMKNSLATGRRVLARTLRIRIFECPHRLSDKLLKSSAASLFLSGAGCAYYAFPLQ
ncbi:OB-fold nucleic acid binding domain-containing protein, partial [Salmonella enterica subsp. enterica serovar Montevideo]|nr:OB-fold nucleic acid binding domain-containing protein [Salmonella enterica subsp. enterica serovar Montevideo]